MTPGLPLAVVLITLAVVAPVRRHSTASAQVSGGLPPCAPTCYKIGDFAWLDSNADGLQQAGEPGLEGVTVSVFEADANGNVTNPTPVRQATTDAQGHYSIEPPPNHIYLVQFDPPGGLVPSTSFGLTESGKDPTHYADSDPDPSTHKTIAFLLDGWQDHGEWWDAGFTATGCHEVGGTLFRDVDDDGEFDAGVDLPLVDVAVELVQEHYFGGVPTYETVDSNTTDANGIYSFACVGITYRMAIQVRDVGLLVPSDFYHEDWTDGADSDNNFVAHPEYQFTTPSVRASTYLKRLPVDHPSPDSAVDGGFTCAASSADVALVVDTSGSMTGNDNVRSKQLADNLVDDVLSPISGQANRVAVIGFDESAVVYYHLSGNRDDAKDAIGHVNVTPHSQTFMETGLNAAITELDGAAAEARVIVLVSDGAPTQGHAEPAVTVANTAKSQGISIITVAIGRPASAFLDPLASSGESAFAVEDTTELPALDALVIGSICGSGRGQFPCTGGSIHEFDLTTGVSQAGGRELNWKVVLPGGDPLDEEQQLQPWVVSRDPHWNLLHGSSWISQDQAAESGITGAIYYYVFDMHFAGEPSAVEVGLRALGDDTIKGVRINGKLLPWSYGGDFDKVFVDVNSRDRGFFQSPSGDYALVANVWDRGGVVTGFDGSGYVRACVDAVPPPPPSSLGWRPDQVCDIGVWNDYEKHLHTDYRDGNQRRRLAYRKVNVDTGEVAFCMKLSVACWGGSLLVSEPPGFVCGSGEVACGRNCGAGHYQIPHHQEFDLGPLNYAAIDRWCPNCYEMWPSPGDPQPGSLVVFGSSDGVFGDTVYRNADTSNIYALQATVTPGPGPTPTLMPTPGAPNQMERYVSTCRRSTGPTPPPSFECPIGEMSPYPVGCVKPLHGSGQISWVKWQVDTVPFTCSP